MLHVRHPVKTKNDYPPLAGLLGFFDKAFHRDAISNREGWHIKRIVDGGTVGPLVTTPAEGVAACRQIGTNGPDDVIEWPANGGHFWTAVGDQLVFHAEIIL